MKQISPMKCAEFEQGSVERGVFGDACHSARTAFEEAVFDHAFAMHDSEVDDEWTDDGDEEEEEEEKPHEDEDRDEGERIIQAHKRRRIHDGAQVKQQQTPSSTLH